MHLSSALPWKCSKKGEIFRAVISEVLVASSGFLPQSKNMQRLIGGSKFTLVVNPVRAL